MENWSSLEQELIRYRDLSSSIRIMLSQYEIRSSELIKEIREKRFEDCQIIFDKLHEIHEELSTTYYKYGFNLNSNLYNFMHFFDRDDIYSRKYWYQKINAGMDWPQNIE